MRKTVIIIICLIFLSCSREEFNITNEEPANTIFNPYLDTFKKEAEQRGYDFNDYEIEFFLADIIEDDIGGFANYSNNKIVIDRENWNSIDLNHKEWLIFHELGHSILNRRHINKKTESGECLSYMRGKLEDADCFSNLYSFLWREYYLDELFNDSTTLPNWYTTNNEYEFNYQNKEYLIQELDSNSGFYELEVKSDTLPKFVLEVTFKDWNSISDNSSFVTTNINVNGFYFISQPRINAFLIGNANIERFFKKNDYSFKEDIKFTIRKNHNVYQFFLDEKFLHATDIDNLKNNILSIDFSSEIKMDIEFFIFD